MAKFDIFICYRRDNGKDLARLIQNALKGRGYKAFMDVEDLKSGDFNEALFKRIEEATDVIVVLTPDCLERCKHEDDWLRQEIRYAIEKQKNIIPVFERNFIMPASRDLPSDISKLSTFHGLTPSHELFDASMDKLVKVYLKTNKVWKRLLITLSILATLFIVLFILFKINITTFQYKSSLKPLLINNKSQTMMNGILKGKITDDITGEPIPKAYIRSSDFNINNIFSDSDGNYFIPNIPVGKYKIEVSKQIMQPLPKSGNASVVIKEGEETIKNIIIQATKFELTTIENSKLIMELLDVFRSLEGSTILSLTKNPSEILNNIIWRKIPIREYNDDIRQVLEIKIIGKPKVYKYPGISEMIYFYPIQLTNTEGQVENLYWQADRLIGYEISKAKLTKQISVPLSSINRVVFIHENN
jgi:hypothetical protein